MSKKEVRRYTLRIKGVPEPILVFADETERTVEMFVASIDGRRIFECQKEDIIYIRDEGSFLNNLEAYEVKRMEVQASIMNAGAKVAEVYGLEREERNAGGKIVTPSDLGLSLS